MGNQACCECESEDVKIIQLHHNNPVNPDMDLGGREEHLGDVGAFMERSISAAAARGSDTPPPPLPQIVRMKREIRPPLCNDKAYTVKLERQGGVRVKLGMELESGWCAILPLLRVTGGLAERWNEANPHLLMEKGDSIVEVNGCRDDAKKMMDRLQRDRVLELTLRTQLTRDHLVADIEKLVEETSCGPLLIQLCWHEPSSSNEADVAGSPLANISAKYCPALISTADLRMLAANVSIRLMGGPDIPVVFGRVDAAPSAGAVLSQEDQDEGVDHLLWIMSAKGFSVKDRVAISGSKCVSSYHVDRPGIKSDHPLRFDNSHFKNLLSMTYHLEILDSDMVLIRDPKFKKLVEKYAADQDAFFTDFAKSWVLLQERWRSDHLRRCF